MKAEHEGTPAGRLVHLLVGLSVVLASSHLFFLNIKLDHKMGEKNFKMKD